ncbi:right-handed parallel beta-helix repeat-containing protein [Streptomyces collinus]|uniref:right-handed parallel beta-helix repeat-containing protein n=1 Tax=Streptomyces collinus TaxID=42684 RepID=UPI002942D474|nr:right-handed parallel beta-helix repeat-containing protein [Streptomyces collinus]
MTNGTATDGGNIFANGGGTIDLALSVVRNGTAFDGGGFFILASATVRIRHSAIHDNTSAGFGAGISSRGNLTIADNTTISDNATGGVGGGLSNSGPTTIDDSKIFSNTAASTGGFRGGGGIFNLNPGTVILHHTRVEHNTVTATANAPGMGGGISNQGVAATVVIDGGKIGHNSVEGTNAQGGGVYNEGMLYTKKLKIEHNTSAGTGAQGGGLTNNGGTATLTSSQVEHNTSSTPPGGINDRAGTVALNDSTVKHNKPTNCAGSAVPVPGCVNRPTGPTGRDRRAQRLHVRPDQSPSPNSGRPPCRKAGVQICDRRSAACRAKASAPSRSPARLHSAITPDRASALPRAAAMPCRWWAVCPSAAAIAAAVAVTVATDSGMLAL